MNRYRWATASRWPSQARQFTRRAVYEHDRCAGPLVQVSEIGAIHTRLPDPPRCYRLS
jgi:hypothetical protein